MYHIVLEGKLKGRRKAFLKKLHEKKIETRECFVPLNKQKIYKNITKIYGEKCPVAEYIGSNGFYLPSGPSISQKELNYVVKSFIEVYLSF